MKFKNFFINNIGSLIFTIIIGLAFVLSIIGDSGIIDISNCIFISQIPLKKIEDFYFIAFQIQATVAALSIAIISIIVGYSKVNHFGISIAKYIMFLKPRIFKYKRLVIIQLLSVLFNFAFLSFNFINLSFCMLILSVFISIKMSVECLRIFNTGTKLIEEIKDFIVNNINKKYIKNILANEFKEELIEAIEKDNFVKLRREITLFKDVYKKVLEENDLEKLKNNISEINDVYSEILIKLYTKKRMIFFSIASKSIIDIYTLVNSRNKEDDFYYLEVWDNVFRSFILCLDKVDFKIDEIRYYFEDLRTVLYNNIDTKTSQDNSIDTKTYQVNHYVSSLVKHSYYRMKKNKCFNAEDYKRINDYWARLFDYELINDYDKYVKTKNKTMIDISIKEILFFIKILIDEKDKELIEKCFFEFLSNYIKFDKKYNVFIINIYIYFYYLAEIETEDFVNIEDKNFYKELLLKYRNNFSEWIFHDTNLEESILENIIINRHEWERMNDGEIKAVLMDKTKNYFVLFICLIISKYSSKSNDDFIEYCKKQTEDRLIFRYLQYFLKETIDKTKEDFIKFRNLCFKETPIDIEIESIDKLNEKLKIAYLEELKNEVINKFEEFEKTSNQLKIELKKIFENKINPLSEKFNIYKPEKQLKITNKYSLDIDTEFENDIHFDRFEKTINNSLFSLFFDTFKDKINIKEINFKSENILKNLLKESNKYKNKIKLNSIIGLNALKHIAYKEKNDDFTKFAESLSKIDFENTNKKTIIVDSTKIFFNIKVDNINLRDLKVEEIINWFKTNKNERGDYNYTYSNINLEFKEEELISYFQKKKKILDFSLEIEYGVSEDKVGYGIEIKYEL